MNLSNISADISHKGKLTKDKIDIIDDTHILGNDVLKTQLENNPYSLFDKN